LEDEKGTQSMPVCLLNSKLKAEAEGEVGALFQENKQVAGNRAWGKREYDKNTKIRQQAHEIGNSRAY